MTSIATRNPDNVLRGFTLVMIELIRVGVPVASMTVADSRTKGIEVSVQVREFTQAVALAELFTLTFRHWEHFDTFEGEWMDINVRIHSTERTPVDGYPSEDAS